MHLFIDVDDGLRVVVARRQGREREGIAGVRIRDDARGRPVDVRAEHGGAAERQDETRLGCRVLRDEHHETPGERARVGGGCDRDFYMNGRRSDHHGVTLFVTWPSVSRNWMLAAPVESTTSLSRGCPC